MDWTESNPSSVHINDKIFIQGKVCRVTKVITTETDGKGICCEFIGYSIEDSTQYTEKYKYGDTVRLPIITPESHVITDIKRETHCDCGCFSYYNCSIMIDNKLVEIRVTDKKLGDSISSGFKKGDIVTVKVNKVSNQREIVDII